MLCFELAYLNLFHLSIGGVEFPVWCCILGKVFVILHTIGSEALPTHISGLGPVHKTKKLCISCDFITTALLSRMLFLIVAILVASFFYAEPVSRLDISGPF